MNDLESALASLRKEPDTEAKSNVLEQFTGTCIHCYSEIALIEAKERLLRYLVYYKFNDIAEMLK